MTDEECKTCGRDDGHWLGCVEAAERQPPPHFWDNAANLADAEKVITQTVCAYGDCEDPPRVPGKGPKPKFCETHSDPKNRK